MTATLITVALLVTLAGPIALAASGSLREWPHWRLTLLSTVLYALAFNLVFFIQEVFLVLPKALTPGLTPTLYHNNHGWEGDNPLARALQGTGALAIFAVGCACLARLALRPTRSAPLRLFALWIAFQGIYQSVPQVVVGAVFEGNDVGMSMAYFGWSAQAKAGAALLALVVIVAAGLWLTKPFVSIAPRAEDIADAAGRSRFIFNVATLPAFAALPIIFLSRAPGSLDQVVIVPIAVTIIGVTWLQANAWRIRGAQATGDSAPRLAIAASALAAVILFFHLVLRPGLTF